MKNTFFISSQMIMMLLLLGFISGCDTSKKDGTEVPDNVSSQSKYEKTVESGQLHSKAVSKVSPEQQSNLTSESKKMSKKVLIAYYSWSPRKNTQAVAKEIQKLTGGDLFKIEMVKPYSTDYSTVLKEAKQDLRSNARPEIKPFDKKVDSYDVIFIGSPIWYGTYAPPVATFLSSHDLAGKTVIPFSTHGGGGSAHYAADAKKLCPKSKVLPEFTHYGPDIENANAEIAEWIKNDDIR